MNPIHLTTRASGLLSLALLLATGAACSADYMSGAEDRLDSGTAQGDTAFGAPGSEDSDADGDYGDPEKENDFLAYLPAQTDIYVFIANPARDTLTRVNVNTLAVDTVGVGRDPRVVLTTRDYSKTVAFNFGDDSVSIVDADTLEVSTVKVRDNFNTMVLSPDGNWAVLWHDENAVRPEDPPTGGLQSFNEASFVNLTTGEHYAMAVGFNPREVQFTPDSTLSAIVSDEYLALVDLQASPLLPRLVPVTDDFVTPPKAEEVLISPSGNWAFVRQFGAQDLVVVDLNLETTTRVPVGANPTDMDLSPDGASAVVVARGDREVWVFDSENPLTINPTVLPLPAGTNFGSVLFTPGGEQALLYTTASPVAQYATWDLISNEIVLRSLVKPIEQIGITPTGGSALIIHSLADAPNADPSGPFYNHHAITMLDLSDQRSNPLRLPAEPIGFANSSDGTEGYFIMKNTPLMEVLDYQTLLYDEIPLRSNPVYIGVLPDLDESDSAHPPAWVSQEHALGRISFYRPDDSSLETITGFELNSQVEN
jgi:DNA-binding beta-propeller fold protein YncE